MTDLFGFFKKAPEPYNGEPPHVKGSETSKEAAESIKLSLTTTELRVMAFYRKRGERGATCDEVEQHLRMRHQSASARVRGLELKGYLEKTERKRKTMSGRKAFVLVATEAA